MKLNKPIIKPTYLDEHSKIDNYEGSSNEHFFPREERCMKQKCKRETTGSTKTTVGNNELVFNSEGVSPELVTDVEESKHT